MRSTIDSLLRQDLRLAVKLTGEAASASGLANSAMVNGAIRLMCSAYRRYLWSLLHESKLGLVGPNLSLIECESLLERFSSLSEASTILRREAELLKQSDTAQACILQLARNLDLSKSEWLAESASEPNVIATSATNRSTETPYWSDLTHESLQSLVERLNLYLTDRIDDSGEY